MDHVELAASLIRHLHDSAGISGDAATELVAELAHILNPYFTRREIARLLRIARLCESYAQWVLNGHRQDRVRARFNMIVKLGKQDSLYLRVQRHLEINSFSVELMFSDEPRPSHPDDLLEFADELRRMAPLLQVRPAGRRAGGTLVQEARTAWALQLDGIDNSSDHTADNVRKLKEHGVRDAVARHTAYDHL